METTPPSTDPPPSSSSSDSSTPTQAPPPLSSLPSTEPQNQNQNQTPAQQQQQRAPPVPRPQQVPVRPVQPIQRPGLAMGVPSGYQRPAGPFSTFRPPFPASVGQNSQKFTSHGVPRPPSIPSSNTPSSIPQSSQSLQQQFWSSQGKQTHTASLSSSPYSPQMNQQFMQQRPQHPQQLQQNQLPIASRQLQMSSSQTQQQRQHPQLQQQQQQGSVPNQSQEYLTPRNQQSPLQQQNISSRGQVSITPNSNIQALTQPSVATLITSDDDADKIISRKRIRELVSQIDRSEKLHPEVEDDLLEIAGDFIESITSAACHLAKHRKSTTLEAKDILLHVERHWNMTLPGFSGDEIKCYKKPSTNDIHKERLSLVKKSMVATSDGGSAKNPSAGGGQAAANPKTHAIKTPANGSPK